MPPVPIRASLLSVVVVLTQVPSEVLFKRFGVGKFEAYGCEMERRVWVVVKSTQEDTQI
jgi:hypothetical protein